MRREGEMEGWKELVEQKVSNSDPHYANMASLQPETAALLLLFRVNTANPTMHCWHSATSTTGIPVTDIILLH